MLIAQISDVHIAPPNQKTYGFVPMAENLKKCVAHINNLSTPPDVVLLSGDVTNDFLLEEAQRAAAILDGLLCPYFVIGGNHDDRNVLWQVFGGGAIPSKVGEFVQYVVEGNPLRIIGLDSVTEGASGGSICDVRADWLEQQLQLGGDTPTLIFLHHPPMKCGVPESDHDGFVGADRFGEIVAKHPNIQRILCGHIHLHTHAMWNGTVVTTAPSMGLQLSLDLTMDRPSTFMRSDPAYLLHHWTKYNRLITHYIQVSDIAGPFPFEDVT